MRPSRGYKFLGVRNGVRQQENNKNALRLDPEIATGPHSALERYDLPARYSLVVSIRTEQTEIDWYNPIAQKVEIVTRKRAQVCSVWTKLKL